MAIDLTLVTAALAAQQAAKTYDPKAFRTLSDAPFTDDDIKAVVAIAPEDKWPDAFRRVARLGGARLAEIDTEVTSLLGTAVGALLRATPSVIAAAIADLEISTDKAASTTESDHRLSVRTAAVKKLRAWENENAPARAEIARAIALLRANLPKAGYTDADLANGASALGVLGQLGVAQKAAA